MTLPHKSDGGSKPLSLFSLKHHARRAAEGAAHFVRRGGKRSKMKRILKYLLIIVAVIAGIAFLGLKKNINLRNMQIHETAHFTIYYESLEKETLADIEQVLEEKYPVIQTFFGLAEEQKRQIVVYESVARFQRAYLGIILSLVYGDWASGAAYQDMVLVTSPQNPGSQHTYDDTLEIIVHEYVHTCVYQLNDMPNIWLDEGVATYLAGQKSQLPSKVPAFEAMQAEDMDTFLENDGYAFSYVYVEFLERTYGSRQVVRLIETNDYEGVLGKSALDVYNEWLLYLGMENSTSCAKMNALVTQPLPQIPSTSTIAICRGTGPRAMR
jgi:hypothetical protein